MRDVIRKVLEEEIKNVSNVVKVLSTSQEDYGIITVEFDEKIIAKVDYPLTGEIY